MIKVRKKRRLSKKEVEHIAHLAKIELSKKEEQTLANQLNKILDYFEKIDKIKTENIAPTYHTSNITNIFREDKPKPFPPKDILQSIPQMKDKWVKAPRIA